MRKACTNDIDQIEIIENIHSLDDVYKFIETFVSDDRRKHIEGVSQIAEKLARRYGADVKKIKIVPITGHMIWSKK